MADKGPNCEKLYKIYFTSNVLNIPKQNLNTRAHISYGTI